MKLGLVRRGFSGTGGAEAYLRRFAAAAAGAGHECVLFASGAWPEEAWSRECMRLRGSTPRVFADALRAAQPRERCDFLFSFERVWECDAFRAGDGVHASWLERRGGSWWGRMVRQLQGKHRDLLALEQALFAGGARCIIANSAMVKREIVSRFQTPPERIHVVHNGVPPWRDEPGRRERERMRLELAESDYAVLFAGSGWERKGLRFAMTAVNAVPGATLLVAGRGRKRGLPKCPAARFLGPQSAEEMRSLLSAADAFVLPTLYEPFSNACLEALAAGLPVITTAANGFAEILEIGVEGEVVADPAETDALAAGIAAWKDPEKRRAVRGRLLEKGMRYSIEGNVAETLRVIDRCRGT
jgi:UDP-glucose:(heptosyl)LPS alpha-1,3-glucosyltransferase